MAGKKAAPKRGKARTAAPVATAAKVTEAPAPAAAEPATEAPEAPVAEATTVTQEIPAAAEAPAVTNETNEGNEEMSKDNSKLVDDRVQAIFGDVNERAKAAFEKNARLVEELTELTRGNVEALVSSSKAAARGVEALGQEAAEYGRKSFEEASAAFRSFAEVKSPTDLFRLQSEFAKTQFDSMVAESSKVSETVLKLAGEVFEPLSSRYSVAAERVKSALAA